MVSNGINCIGGCSGMDTDAHCVGHRRQTVLKCCSIFIPFCHRVLWSILAFLVFGGDTFILPSIQLHRLRFRRETWSAQDSLVPRLGDALQQIEHTLETGELESSKRSDRNRCIQILLVSANALLQPEERQEDPHRIGARYRLQDPS